MDRVKTDPVKALVESICVTLREIREKRGLSQVRLAEIAGISRTGLRHIENLEASPTLASLLRISEALEVDLASLLRE